jgi:hypothetical protein
MAGLNVFQTLGCICVPCGTDSLNIAVEDLKTSVLK